MLGHRTSGTSFTFISWVAVFGMMAVIFWFSSQTGEHLDSGIPIVSDLKALLANLGHTLVGHPVDVSPVGHFLEYLLLGALLMNALSLSTTLSRALWSALAFASLYGITDEVHQLFVSGRSADPMDWLVDTVAALVGILIVRALCRTPQMHQISQL